MLMRKYIVNNQEVEHLHIEEKDDGSIEIHYEEKFNLLTAHHSKIMRRLRDNNIDGCHVVNHEIRYKVILIHLKSIDQLTGALHALDIPYGCYEVSYEEALVTIDTPVYKRLIGAVNSVGNEKQTGKAL